MRTKLQDLMDAEAQLIEEAEPMIDNVTFPVYFDGKGGKFYEGDDGYREPKDYD